MCKNNLRDALPNKAIDLCHDENAAFWQAT